MTTAYHEPTSELSKEVRELHRAINSLMEEFEAVDWYNQRADVTDDEQLEAILLHNRNEELEHAAMALEWLRRRMPRLDELLRQYLFTTSSITRAEHHDDASVDSGAGRASRGDLGLRSMRGGS
jgi:ferritin-like protein